MREINLRCKSSGNVTKWREKKASGVECNLASPRKRNAQQRQPRKFLHLHACACARSLHAWRLIAKKMYLQKIKRTPSNATAALHFLSPRSAARFALASSFLSMARLAALYVVGSLTMLGACALFVFCCSFTLSRPKKGKQKQQLWIWHQIRFASCSLWRRADLKAELSLKVLG